MNALTLFSESHAQEAHPDIEETFESPESVRKDEGLLRLDLEGKRQGISKDPIEPNLEKVKLTEHPEANRCDFHPGKEEGQTGCGLKD